MAKINDEDEVRRQEGERLRAQARAADGPQDGPGHSVRRETHRDETVDAETVVGMRRVMAKRGGDENVRKRYGEQALGGAEHKAARRQLEAARARPARVEQAQRAERAQQVRERVAKTQERIKEANQRQAQRAQTQDRSAVQAM